MLWFKAILLGIVEGITEFLPVSSTGHLLLAEHWLTPDPSILTSDVFNVVIQCGAVLAVIAVFKKRAAELLSRWSDPKNLDYLAKLSLAFVVTAIGGLVLKHFGFTLPKTITPIAWATLIGGVLILLIEYSLKGKRSEGGITWLVALVVGLAQVLAATCPGTSRSGATILFALALGVARPAAAEFAFLLGIPTMFAAGAVELHSALKKEHYSAQDWEVMLLSTVVAGFVALLVVRWLMRFIQTRTFSCFGWYRIVLGIVMLWLIRK